MAARLRLTLRTIPWSLALKAAIFAGAWLLLPFWLFFLLALGLYFFPPFEPGRLLWPYLATLFFAAVFSPTLLSALFLGLIFYLVLGIKDLIFIYRFQAYEALIFLLFTLGFLNFFLRYDRLIAPDLLPASLGLALLFTLLLRGFFLYGAEENKLPPGRGMLLPGLALFLLGEWVIALLFLPLSLFFQTAILLLGAVSLTELLWSYKVGELGRREILLHFSVFFAFLVVVLAANIWKI